MVRRRALRRARGPAVQLPDGRARRCSATPPGRSSHRIEGERGAEAAADATTRSLRERVAAAPTASRCSTSCCSGSARTVTPRRCSRATRRSRARGRVAVAVHDAPKPPPDRVSLTLDGAAGRARLPCCSRAARARPRRSRGCSPAPTRRSRRACSTRDRLTVVADAAALRRWG